MILPQCVMPMKTPLRDAADRSHADPAHANLNHPAAGRSSFPEGRACAVVDFIAHEVKSFLDSQDIPQPFRWPQWAGDGARLALLRHNGQIQWLAQCGVTYPASRFLRPIWAFNRNFASTARFTISAYIKRHQCLRICAISFVPITTSLKIRFH
jgi:hypothetical protein